MTMTAHTHTTTTHISETNVRLKEMKEEYTATTFSYRIKICIYIEKLKVIRLVAIKKSHMYAHILTVYGKHVTVDKNDNEKPALTDIPMNTHRICMIRAWLSHFTFKTESSSTSNNNNGGRIAFYRDSHTIRALCEINGRSFFRKNAMRSIVFCFLCAQQQQLELLLLSSVLLLLVMLFTAFFHSSCWQRTRFYFIPVGYTVCLLCYIMTDVYVAIVPCILFHALSYRSRSR